MKKEKVKVYCKHCVNYHPFKRFFKKGMNWECYRLIGTSTFLKPGMKVYSCKNPRILNEKNDCKWFESLRKYMKDYCDIYWDHGERRWKRMVKEDCCSDLIDEIKTFSDLLEHLDKLLAIGIAKGWDNE